LIKIAEQNGFKALVLTIDRPVLGKRDSARKIGFKMPEGIFYNNHFIILRIFK
jgi:hypothetical protein